MKVTRASLSDETGITELENICFQDPWTARMVREMLEGSFDEVYTAKDENGMPAGYADLRHIGDAEPECEILRICVRPEYRRLHTGELLMKTMLDRAKDIGAPSVFLEVRASNEPAIGLYKKHGFEQVLLRKNYYSQPDEDALIMQLRFRP